MLLIIGAVMLMSAPWFFSCTLHAQAIALPNAKQIKWYHREVMVFLHFSMNTFTGNEWGDGTDKPSVFNPTDLDCDQWIRTVKNAGFTCAILTAKHHDGFCLWPSAQTTYDVAASPWKDGKGDVIREFTDACRKYGVKAGLYLSPWDRHEPSYGTAAYNTFYMKQLRELLTGYGPICEIWWDGAGDQMAFDFRQWADTITSLQPDCFIFGAKKASPYVDGRWIGNEDGVAGDPCWATIDRSVIDVENLSLLSTGQVNGSSFVPAECDVTIRPGWYFHAAENTKVKSTATLWNTNYFGSVGRNAVLLLNLPPDTRGRIYATDSTRLDSLGGWIRGTFATNLATGATVTSRHGENGPYPPSMTIDTSENTWYAVPEPFTTDTLLFDLGASCTFDCALLQERIESGQRITTWSLDAYYNEKWNGLATNKQGVGYKRIIKFATVTATQVRIRITAGKAGPMIHTFGLFRSRYAAAPVTAMLPPRLTDKCSQHSGSFRVAGRTLLLPEAFSHTMVRVELFDLLGRTIAVSFVHGNRAILPSPEVLRNSEMLYVRCTADKATASAVVTVPVVTGATR